MKRYPIEVHLTPEQLGAALVKDVVDGLSAVPKTLPPKWFYDARGSELFERITELPEYYPTRTERRLLTDNAAEIAELSRADTLVELGSGSSEKTTLLLNALSRAGTLRRYVPQDVSVSALEGAVERIGRTYPGIEIRGVVSDFEDALDALPGGDCRLVAFLGGTIGNLVPDERRRFLGALAAVLEAGEKLLLGVGLVTDRATLEAAYDDSAGVTAEFNRNVLSVLNRELSADFDVEAFRHVALWNAEQSWIEMRLRATRPMVVHIRDVGVTTSFAEGEELRTEVSAKFEIAGVAAELDESGFRLTQQWVDPARRFALVLAERR